MNTVSAALHSFWLEEDAPTMAEYGLLLILIAFACAATVFGLGEGVRDLFVNTAAEIGTPTPPPLP